MDMFFLYLLFDIILNFNYNFIIVEFIFSIKDIFLYMKNYLNVRRGFLCGCKVKCVWFGMYYFKNCECVLIIL